MEVEGRVLWSASNDLRLPAATWRDIAWRSSRSPLEDHCDHETLPVQTTLPWFIMLKLIPAQLKRLAHLEEMKHVVGAEENRQQHRIWNILRSPFNLWTIYTISHPPEVTININLSWSPTRYSSCTCQSNSCKKHVSVEKEFKQSMFLRCTVKILVSEWEIWELQTI